MLKHYCIIKKINKWILLNQDIIFSNFSLLNKLSYCGAVTNFIHLFLFCVVWPWNLSIYFLFVYFSGWQIQPIFSILWQLTWFMLMWSGEFCSILVFLAENEARCSFGLLFLCFTLAWQPSFLSFIFRTDKCEVCCVAILSFIFIAALTAWSFFHLSFYSYLYHGKEPAGFIFIRINLGLISKEPSSPQFCFVSVSNKEPLWYCLHGSIMLFHCHQTVIATVSLWKKDFTTFTTLHHRDSYQHLFLGKKQKSSSSQKETELPSRPQPGLHDLHCHNLYLVSNHCGLYLRRIKTGQIYNLHASAFMIYVSVKEMPPQSQHLFLWRKHFPVVTTSIFWRGSIAANFVVAPVTFWFVLCGIHLNNHQWYSGSLSQLFSTWYELSKDSLTIVSKTTSWLFTSVFWVLSGIGILNKGVFTKTIVQQI